MASDFGDDAGEKLFDWFLRIGQDAGQGAMTAAASKLAVALRHAKEGRSEAEEAMLPEGKPASEWAKLDMAEFKALDGYPQLQQAISDKLASEGLEHVFFDDERDSKTYLLFRTADAAQLSRCFDELIETAEASCAKASEALAADRCQAKDHAKDKGKARSARDGKVPDERPLDERAEQARVASAELERQKGSGRAREHEAPMQEVRSK